MLVVEIKKPGVQFLKEADATDDMFDQFVNFMRTSPMGKAAGNAITKKLIDALAAHYGFKSNSLTYELLTVALAKMKLEELYLLVDDTKKGAVCKIIGNNLVSALFETVGKELAKDLKDFVIGKNAKTIGSGIDMAVAAALMTIAETRAGQKLSTDIATSLCSIDFKAFLKDIPGFGEAAGAVGSFFGKMFE